MFRIAHAKALINRFGFNSVGADAFAERMKAWREREDRTRNPVGVNLGKNKETTDDAADFLICLEKVAPYADYVTVNISSPNTPGLRDIQTPERMAALLAKVTEKRDAVAPKLPVLVKIAPDLTEEQQGRDGGRAFKKQDKGVVVGNILYSP
jgi:dihydroorotate dehydrogenase